MISVIVPTYNSIQTIDRCVRSILQNPGVELIIVDDCSTDGTWQYIQKWKDRAILLQNRMNHGGPNHSCNRGMNIATQEWIAIIDHDDEVSPSKFRYLSGLDIVSCDYTIMSDHGKRYVSCGSKHIYGPNEVFNSLMTTDPSGLKVQVQNLIFSREIAPRFNEIVQVDDFSFILDLFKGRSCFHVKKSLLTRYIHGENLGSTIRYKESILKVKQCVAVIYPQMKKGIREHQSCLARYYYYHGLPVRARKSLLSGQFTLKNVYLFMTSYFPVLRTFTINHFNILGK